MPGLPPRILPRLSALLLAAPASLPIPVSVAQTPPPPPPSPVPSPGPVASPGPPPPLPPLPPAGPRIPALDTPDPLLEAAIRARLFEGPRSGAQLDPDTTEWEQARSRGAHPSCAEVGPLRYLHNRIDLDGDLTPEAVVAVVGSYACGAGGCTLLIFRSTAGSLQPVLETGLFQSPLSVISRRHAGWLDLTMPGTASGVSSGLLDLRFDGSSYRITSGESGSPQAPASQQGTVVLETPALPFEQLGLPLPCAP